ncbi:Na/Pi cotransporter family protein [Psychrilyobacter atlanticus]|uniref:Na/Pi cotransporter family protein n=1 Tax=Psychrilyobacter atlanticus TaxID=271091 RepID=UPI000409F5D3|nr:Na/Pi cotransporter family protein [Psychrilyobacter atlanticus]
MGDALNIILNVIGGLGIFLYGMENMANAMQKVAGDKLKNVIAIVTKNRFLGVLVGIIITILVQSSSVTTVMVIGFVNASLMNLTQALGVILGANIGTTAVGWLLILKVGKYGLPLAGIGAIIGMFAKTEKGKEKSKLMMGIGLIFFGMELMKNGFEPLRAMPEFVAMFQRFHVTGIGSAFLVAMVGAFLTAIVQASAATLGITIMLASQGLIDAQTGVAIVMGLNVGTTITAFLASFGAKANAKRAAYAHTIINIFGLLWVLPIYGIYTKMIGHIVDPNVNISGFLAAAHTIFNVTNAVLFIFLLTPLANFLKKIIPNDEVKAKKYTHLDVRMLETPTLAIEQTKAEVASIGDDIKLALEKVKTVIENNLPKNSDEIAEVFRIEEKVDMVQSEVAELNSQILGLDIEQHLVMVTRKNIAICDQYESLTDYAERIMKVYARLKENDLTINEHKKQDLFMLHNAVVEFFELVNTAYVTNNVDITIEAVKKSTEITNMYRKARKGHLERMGNDKKQRPMLSTGHMDMLNHYRRLSDHMLTVVEIMNI